MYIRTSRFIIYHLNIFKVTMSSKIINVLIYYKMIFSMFDKINEHMRGDNIVGIWGLYNRFK